jgi:hypothetical protein
LSRLPWAKFRYSTSYANAVSSFFPWHSFNLIAA